MEKKTRINKLENSLYILSICIMCAVIISIVFVGYISKIKDLSNTPTIQYGTRNDISKDIINNLDKKVLSGDELKPYLTQIANSDYNVYIEYEDYSVSWHEQTNMSTQDFVGIINDADSFYCLKETNKNKTTGIIVHYTETS